MALFLTRFPEVAKTETRGIVVSEGNLRRGTYLFTELYCSRPACDCRNMMINVEEEQTRKRMATINHSLDPDRFADIGEQQTFLDRLNRAKS